jgi:uncharacterized protein involved in oxidation of intracellular sulfur
MTREISRAELRARRAAGEAIVVVDVRSAEEFAAGHIDGAIHLPVAEIEADPTRLPLDRPIVTACGKGGGRSEGAAAALAAAGAGALSKREGEEVRVFLMGDAAACARAGQKVPTGYYNVQVMLGAAARHRGQIGVCGTCMDARGLAAEGLTEGARRSTLDELTTWTQWAEKALVF